VRAFARLYARLDETTSTNAKLAALRDYFASADPADAAWAVYFLSGNRPRQVVSARVLRVLAARVAGLPDWLFDESYDVVGDLAETIAHVLPAPGSGSDRPLAEWVERRLLPLRGLAEAEAEARILDAWRELDRTGRFVWNKLITGGFRVGVSRLLVTRAIAEAGGVDPGVIAERLAGRWEPTPERYRALLSCDGDADRAGRPYPFFLAHPLQAPPAALGDVGAWHAEWKWDGIRAQLVRRQGRTFLWSRGDELITERFPEIRAAGDALPDGTVIDGEVLAWRAGAPLPFSSLQQRIGRKTLTAKVLAEAPAVLVAYDLLEHAGYDLRAWAFQRRRDALADLLADAAQPVLLLSPAVEGASWEALEALRAGSRERGVEGLMLKRRDSAYGAGRVKLGPGGEWWKWKIDPLSVDAVLVYAQRGHGRRASLYTDYTFAVWRDRELVPFAKAYSGLTDAEIRSVDAFVRANTLERFGPVRSVTPKLVMEIGFEGIQRSARHKSGIAVRFPRMLRIRSDKKIEEADTLERLRAFLNPSESP
jgi:DNA ligase-1